MTSRVSGHVTKLKLNDISEATHFCNILLSTLQMFTDKGSFTNYMDQFLTYFDHLPTYRGLSWTFGALPTPCPRGHRKT